MTYASKTLIQFLSANCNRACTFLARDTGLQLRLQTRPCYPHGLAIHTALLSSKLQRTEHNLGVIKFVSSTSQPAPHDQACHDTSMKYRHSGPGHDAWNASWLPSLVFGRLLPRQKLANGCVNSVMVPEGHISRHKVTEFDAVWKAANVLAPDETNDAAGVFWSQYNSVGASIDCGMCSATAPCKYGSQPDGSAFTEAFVLFLPHTICCTTPFTGSFWLTGG